MKVLVPAAAFLLLAGAADAQTAPQTPPPRSASDLTRDLNSGPPTIEEYLARPPAATTPPPAAPATPPGAAVQPEPAPARPTPTSPAPDTRRSSIPEPFEAPGETQPPRPAPIPVEPSPAARTAPITPAPPPAARVEPLAPPAAAPAAEPAPPPTPAVAVLDAAARAALPFSVELPAGFQIVTGRPGPDFRIYTIRRGERSFVMVYVGPASQFPIYTGEMVEAGGRASVVLTEQGARHAVEHLFQRAEAPREIHVWTMTLDGADRALAEQIAQSVDVR
ncbi:hypothetical protein [Brevundimonas viscosa]|uniref:DUF4367 domain-containing protein n=1 Tax=Brevundimonas viscosa TaxID=871741 RepID=A0A1I6QBB2_9CAUL|nr:hypothetical protein [Brevundimonas viscosa]SFS49757.1 hypothetical protein SAMN05192570_1637 [Brevundimonas viscosa]